MTLEELRQKVAVASDLEQEIAGLKRIDPYGPSEITVSTGANLSSLLRSKVILEGAKVVLDQAEGLLAATLGEKSTTAEIEKNEEMPPQFAQKINEWLKSNEKAPEMVRHGTFPLGMVWGWIERAEKAERKLKVLSERGTMTVNGAIWPAMRDHIITYEDVVRLAGLAKESCPSVTYRYSIQAAIRGNGGILHRGEKLLLVGDEIFSVYDTGNA